MYFSWQLEMGPEESGSCTSGLKFFWVWLPDQSESSPKKAGFSHCSTTLLLSTLHSRTLNDELIFSNNCATEQCHRERTSRTTLCKRYLGLERRKVNDYRGKIFNLALLHSLFNHGSQKLEIDASIHCSALSNTSWDSPVSRSSSEQKENDREFQGDGNSKFISFQEQRTIESDADWVKNPGQNCSTVAKYL